MEPHEECEQESEAEESTEAEDAVEVLDAWLGELDFLTMVSQLLSLLNLN